MATPDTKSKDIRNVQPITPTTHKSEPPPPPPARALEVKAPDSAATPAGKPEPAVEVKRAAPEAAAAPAPVILVAGELTREQKLALFAAAFEAEKKVTEAEKAVETAALVLSEKIKTLITALGGKQGPWNVREFNEFGIRARFRNDVAYFLRQTDNVDDI